MDIRNYPPATRVFFETAQEALAKMDAQSVCRRTGAAYDPARDQFVITYLGTKARVHAGDCSLEWDGPINSMFHITLLHYLIHADGRTPTGEPISLYEAAPAGSTRIENMLKSCIPPLIEVFADDLELFFASAAQLGGEKISRDTAKISILPHIPTQITIWPADDEFPADARLLFDKTLHGQLFAEDLPYIADVAVQALVWASGKPYQFAARW